MSLSKLTQNKPKQPKHFYVRALLIFALVLLCGRALLSQFVNYEPLYGAFSHEVRSGFQFAYDGLILVTSAGEVTCSEQFTIYKDENQEPVPFNRKLQRAFPGGGILISDLQDASISRIVGDTANVLETEVIEALSTFDVQVTDSTQALINERKSTFQVLYTYRGVVNDLPESRSKMQWSFLGSNFLVKNSSARVKFALPRGVSRQLVVIKSVITGVNDPLRFKIISELEGDQEVNFLQIDRNVPMADNENEFIMLESPRAIEPGEIVLVSAEWPTFNLLLTDSTPKQLGDEE